jgi:hypothetical protein
VLLRQLLSESTLLAFAVGVVRAAWGTDALLRLVPGYIPRLDEVRVDAVVLAFALLIALGTALVTGLVPGLAASAAATWEAASTIARSTTGRQVALAGSARRRRVRTRTRAAHRDDAVRPHLTRPSRNQTGLEVSRA